MPNWYAFRRTIPSCGKIPKQHPSSASSAALLCGDRNNRELHGKPLIGKAFCLPQIINSTTGGLLLYCTCAMQKNPACMLFANHIDSLAAAGAVPADVWVDSISMPVADSPGDEFLNYVKDGMKITVKANGVVECE